MVYDIYEIKEYVRMDWHCSHDSYFKCLAKRFQGFKFSGISSKINQGYFNTSKCQWNKICTPISLPPIGDIIIPLCEFLSIDENCQKLTLDKLRLDQEKYCRRSCIVREYRTEETDSFNNNFPIPNVVVFGYKFDSPQSNDMRSEKPFKKVYTEYLAMTLMSLIGTVGGTLVVVHFSV